MTTSKSSPGIPKGIDLGQQLGVFDDRLAVFAKALWTWLLPAHHGVVLPFRRHSGTI
jgi:hypothetical protein